MASKEEKAAKRAEYEAKKAAEASKPAESASEQLVEAEPVQESFGTSEGVVEVQDGTQEQQEAEALTKIEELATEAPQAPQAPQAPKADERTLGEQAAQVTESVKQKGKLKLGKASLTPQEDALLREVVQLQYHQEGRAVQQKDVTQDMVDELCAYGSFLGKLGWLRAKYHESMKK